MKEEFNKLVNSLNISELEELQKKLKPIDSNISKRLEFLIMIRKNSGKPISEMASLLNVNRRTLSRWKNKFLNGGFNELIGEEFFELKNLSLESTEKVNKWINSGILVNKSDEDLGDFLDENLEGEFDKLLITKVIKIALENYLTTKTISKNTIYQKNPDKENKGKHPNIKEMVQYEAKKFLKYLKERDYKN